MIQPVYRRIPAIVTVKWIDPNWRVEKQLQVPEGLATPVQSRMNYHQDSTSCHCNLRNVI